MNSITPSGFYVRGALRGYNHVNPSGLLEIQEELTELKEMKKKSRRDEMIVEFQIEKKQNPEGVILL